MLSNDIVRSVAGDKTMTSIIDKRCCESRAAVAASRLLHVHHNPRCRRQDAQSLCAWYHENSDELTLGLDPCTTFPSIATLMYHFRYDCVFLRQL